jgi:hypothetical protein
LDVFFIAQLKRQQAWIGQKLDNILHVARITGTDIRDAVFEIAD